MGQSESAKSLTPLGLVAWQLPSRRQLLPLVLPVPQSSLPHSHRTVVAALGAHASHPIIFVASPYFLSFFRIAWRDSPLRLLQDPVAPTEKPSELG